jgi:DNA-directed RNA polymerase specialized sigma24 family protein
MGAYHCSDLWINYKHVILDNEGSEELERRIEQAQRYEEVIGNLESDIKDFFIMYLEGIPPREIAERYGVDSNWLRVNISRIKKRLYLRYKDGLKVE